MCAGITPGNGGSSAEPSGFAKKQGFTAPPRAFELRSTGCGSVFSKFEK
jgi:hypothetical protein